MANDLFLVVGAAGGRQGQTGRHVAELMLSRHMPVRAFVHRLDERSAHLQRLGAEIIEGDLRDINSVQRAVQGVSAVYFAYPVQDGLLEATATMAIAAHDVGVTRLANLVMLRSSPDAPTPRMRQNYLSERLFEWAQTGTVHLRAAVFYENLLALIRLSLGRHGTIRLPWGDDDPLIPMVSAEDVARVAVGVLTSPPAQAGAAHHLIGAVHSLHDILGIVSRVLGRKVRYEAISDDTWNGEAQAFGYDPHAIEHLSNLWRFFRSAGAHPRPIGHAVGESIETLGGAKPKAFEAFLRESNLKG